tara:strand:- start:18 stop:524 length:507 start_codon:yes stop_codon:yes gene_type:complete
MSDDLAARVAALEKEVRDINAREEIRVLRCRYHECINEGLSEQIPELFTEDATLDFGYLGRARGREKISKFFAQVPIVLEFVKQFIHNHVIELDGDSGKGWSYLEAKSISKGTAYFVAGRYDDEYVRVDGAWRFSRMDFEPYFTVPFNEPEGWAQDERLKMARREGRE